MSAARLDKSEARIRRMFGAIAPVYDLLNHVLSLNIDTQWRRATVALAPPRGTAPILDLATGTGDLALEYWRAGKGKVPIVGADFCGAMLDRACRKTHRLKASDRIRYIQADAQRLPFPDDHFQLVSIAFGLRNVTDTDRGLAEMVRVVQPGGRVVILEFSKPTNPWFASLYQTYFRTVLPFIGQVVSRSRDQAYRYLPASVLTFPDGERLAEVMRRHGLVNVRYQPLTLGIATIYLGEKP